MHNVAFGSLEALALVLICIWVFEDIIGVFVGKNAQKPPSDNSNH